MTPNNLIDGVRFLLHDTARQTDTGAYFYATATIERALTDALAVVAKTLIRQKPRQAVIVTSALYATFVPTWATVAGSRSAPLPDNFFILECGSLAGVYIPAIRTALGETAAALTISKLYARNGRVYGPEADVVTYFKRPVTIVAGDTALPDFSDAVYSCAKMLACRETVIQESKGASHRWQFFDNDYKMQMEAML